MPGRLSDQEESRLIAAYRTWDGSGGADSFVEPFGISRQTLYAVLRRHNVPTKAEQRVMEASGETGLANLDVAQGLLLDVVGAAVGKALLEEHFALRARLQELEDGIARGDLVWREELEPG